MALSIFDQAFKVDLDKSKVPLVKLTIKEALKCDILTRTLRSEPQFDRHLQLRHDRDHLLPHQSRLVHELGQQKLAQKLPDEIFVEPLHRF